MPRAAEVVKDVWVQLHPQPASGYAPMGHIEVRVHDPNMLYLTLVTAKGERHGIGGVTVTDLQEWALVCEEHLKERLEDYRARISA